MELCGMLYMLIRLVGMAMEVSPDCHQLHVPLPFLMHQWETRSGD